VSQQKVEFGRRNAGGRVVVEQRPSSSWNREVSPMWLFALAGFAVITVAVVGPRFLKSDGPACLAGTEIAAYTLAGSFYANAANDVLDGDYLVGSGANMDRHKNAAMAMVERSASMRALLNDSPACPDVTAAQVAEAKETTVAATAAANRVMKVIGAKQ
jgi:hypothetical protein